MCSCRRIFTLFLVGGVIAAILVGILNQPSDPFKVNKTGYWGPAKLKSIRDAPEDDITVRKFSVHVPEEALVDLRRRLAATRFAAPLEDAKFEYGFNGYSLRKVVDYWKDKFDWRAQERRLNQFEHYRTAIEGIQVHFMYAKPKVTDPKTKVVTLLMTHGWPGSVVEFLKIVPMLTEPRDGIAFEVFCPSIPGYGFSEAPHKKGFNALETARVFVKLMERLGRREFYVQGGDWGAMVSKLMAIYYPDRVLGAHFNMMDVEMSPLLMIKLTLGNFFPSLIFGDEVDFKTFPLPTWSRFSFLLQESGYMHLQGTKPDTIGAALLNTPAGVAAYILEKFSTWTRGDNTGLEDGGLTSKFTLDELLTNVMLYWVTDSIGSSFRYYKENIGCYEMIKPRRTPVTVPSSFSVFPEELVVIPAAVVGHAYKDIVSCNYHTKGGHFPAMEEPALLEKDVRAFVSAVESRNKTKPYTGAPGPFRFVEVGPLAPKVTLTFGPETTFGAETPTKTRFEPKVVPKEPVKEQPAVQANQASQASPPKPTPKPTAQTVKTEPASSGSSGSAKPTPQPASQDVKPTPKQGQKPAEKPVTKPVEKQAAKPATKPAGQPAKTPPVDPPSKPTAKSAPSSQGAGQPAAQQTKPEAKPSTPPPSRVKN